jgi:prepilin-type N-terminal cleavage/methylation domain-containing protein
MKIAFTTKFKGDRRRGFTLVEIMITLVIVVSVMAMCLSTFLFSLRMMYKDTQRLITNASLRSFMAQISKETLDASTFYLFPYYTALDGSVNLATDPCNPTAPEIDAAGTEFDKWIAHGDCLVLITKTSLYRTTDIRQIRIYYRPTTNQTTVNNEATIRYYETTDWGEGSSTISNGHPFSSLATDLNAINLNSNPNLSGSKQLTARSKGRKVASPYTGYTAGDLYPVFSTESGTANPANGFISINVEFINGSNTGTNRLLSSSSFNYTISPRR